MITEYSTSERLPASILISCDIPFDYAWKAHKNRNNGQLVDIIEFHFVDDSGRLNDYVEAFNYDMLCPNTETLSKSKVIMAQRLIAKIIKQRKYETDLH